METTQGKPKEEAQRRKEIQRGSLWNWMARTSTWRPLKKVWGCSSLCRCGGKRCTQGRCNGASCYPWASSLREPWWACVLFCERRGGREHLGSGHSYGLMVLTRTLRLREVNVTARSQVFYCIPASIPSHPVWFCQGWGLRFKFTRQSFKNFTLITMDTGLGNTNLI